MFADKGWQPIVNNPGNLLYDKNHVPVVLPSKHIASCGRRYLFLKVSNSWYEIENSMIDYYGYGTSQNYIIVDDNGRIIGPINTHNKWNYVKEGIFQYTYSIGDLNIVQDVNVVKNNSYQYATKYTPITGSGVSYVYEEKRVDDKKIEKKLNFYSSTGLLWSLDVPFYQAYSPLRVEKLFGDLIFIEPYGTYNVYTGHKYSRIELFTDGKIALEMNFGGKNNKLIDVKTGEILKEGDRIGGRKITNEYIESVGSGNSEHTIGNIGRYSRKDFSEIERITISGIPKAGKEQSDSFYMLDSYENYALVNKAGYGFLLYDCDNKKIVKKLPANEIKIEHNMLMLNGRILIEDRSGDISLYDLDIIENGEFKKINQLKWPDYHDTVVGKDKIYDLIPFGESTAINIYDVATYDLKSSFEIPYMMRKRDRKPNNCEVIINEDDSVFVVNSKPRLSLVKYSKNGDQLSSEEIVYDFNTEIIYKSKPVIYNNKIYLIVVAKINDQLWKNILLKLDIDGSFEQFLISESNEGYWDEESFYFLNDEYVSSMAINENYICFVLDTQVHIMDQMTKSVRKLENGATSLVLAKNILHMINSVTYCKTANLSSKENNIQNSYFFSGANENKSYYVVLNKKKICTLFSADNKSFFSNSGIPVPAIRNIKDWNSSIPTLFGDLIFGDPYVMNIKGEFIQYLPIERGPMYWADYKLKDGSLIRSTTNSIFCLTPCNTFSIKKQIIGDKIELTIKNTTNITLKNPLSGNIRIMPYGTDGKAPIFHEFDKQTYSMPSLKSGESASILIPFPEMKTLDNELNMTNTDYFALIIESNGLLDTKNSELSDFDKEGRPLFDGVPTSLEKQQAIVVTVWKK